LLPFVPTATPPRTRAVSAATLDLPEPVLARPGDPPAHHVRAALDLRMRAMLRHDPGTRLGEDIEELHQMRVSVRRMRATLKAARPLLDTVWADGLRAELGWLGGALGPVRDLDVMLLRLRGEAATLPDQERAAAEILVGGLETEHVAARTTMLGALNAPRYTTLVERLADAVRLPLPTPSATETRPELIDLVRKEVRRLAKAVDRAGEDPVDEVLHALRIDGKRVRYTGELVEPAMGRGQAKVVKRLLAATAELQEVLGDHQDACVAEHRIRQLLDALADGSDGGIDAHVVFVAGRLVERERTRALAMRAQWRPAWEQVRARADEL
jgi:CHAD domain-containing protein